MIELRNVYFRYPNGTIALKNISLTVDKGIFVVLGPNGAGKTTLLKTMGLILRPTRGEVIVEGINFWKARSEPIKTQLRRSVVYVHEEPVMLRGSVAYNVACGLMLRGVPKEVALRRAFRILDELGIKGLAEKRASSLSAGEKRLVTVARALLVEPKYLLLDEPTSNLDFEKRNILLDLIKDYSTIGTILIATHDDSVINKLNAETIYIRQGAIMVCR